MNIILCLSLLPREQKNWFDTTRTENIQIASLLRLVYSEWNLLIVSLSRILSPAYLNLDTYIVTLLSTLFPRSHLKLGKMKNSSG